MGNKKKTVKIENWPVQKGSGDIIEKIPTLVRHRPSHLKREVDLSL